MKRFIVIGLALALIVTLSAPAQAGGRAGVGFSRGFSGSFGYGSSFRSFNGYGFNRFGYGYNSFAFGTPYLSYSYGYAVTPAFYTVPYTFAPSYSLALPAVTQQPLAVEPAAVPAPTALPLPQSYSSYGVTTYAPGLCAVPLATGYTGAGFLGIYGNYRVFTRSLFNFSSYRSFVGTRGFFRNGAFIGRAPLPGTSGRAGFTGVRPRVAVRAPGVRVNVRGAGVRTVTRPAAIRRGAARPAARGGRRR